MSPLILNLETATKTCSVALARNGELLAYEEVTSEKFSHAEKLNGFITAVLSKASCSMKDLDAVAVSAGPGSYTGLRIGTSTAKGLCFGLDVPLISVNSLRALAVLKSIDEGFLCPMFDARRMEVYTAVYSSNLEELEATRAQIIGDENGFEELLEKGQVYFFGPGAEKCQNIIRHENAFFDLDLGVSAQGMVELSNTKFKSGDFEDVAYFEPAYLKDFVAGLPKKLI